MSKNIIRGDKEPHKPQNQSVSVNTEPVDIRKTLTTSGVGSFVPNQEIQYLSGDEFGAADKVESTVTNVGFVVDDVFRDKPALRKVLQDNGLFYTRHIPRDVDMLITLKGIGRDRAKQILERLKEYETE